MFTICTALAVGEQLLGELFELIWCQRLFASRPLLLGHLDMGEVRDNRCSSLHAVVADQ